jgi:hypothetical protein
MIFERTSQSAWMKLRAKKGVSITSGFAALKTTDAVFTAADERNLWWLVVSAILCIISIWYNFGLFLGAMIEEWDLLYLMKEHPPFWNSFPGQTLSELTVARPLLVLPFFFASYLFPNSFVGLHVILMLACALRITGSAFLGYYLFRNRLLATTLGLLSLVFPADTQQFEFRTLHINLAVGMMVFSAALVVWAFAAEPSLRRWGALISSVVLSCTAVLIYEPVFSLYAIAPLILFARKGLVGVFYFLRSRMGLVFVYLVGPAINISYLYYAILIVKSSYQVNTIQGSATNSIRRNLHYLIDSAVYRIFYDAWVSAWDILVNQTAHYGFLIVLAIALVGGFAALAHRSEIDVSRSYTFRCVGVGILLILAGYMPYTVAESHMMITQRTFMGSAFGSALVLVALIAWSCQRASIVGVISSAFIVFIGLVAQIYEFDRYSRDYAEIILPYTSMLADRADPSKKVHLVIDQTGFGGHLNGMYVTKVSYAPIVRGGLNNDPFILCMDGPPTPYLLFSSCNLADGEWTVRTTNDVVLKYPQDDVQVITLGPDFDSTYRSRSGLWNDHGSYSKADSIFVTPAPDSYHCIADGMWGYSGFCRGNGWSDGIFSHKSFRHEIYVAAVTSDPTLLFRLLPRKGNYLFRMTLFDELSAENTSRLKMEFNGQPVRLIAATKLVLEAEVPAKTLKDGLNEIRFQNVTPVGTTTGLAVSRFDLMAIND